MEQDRRFRNAQNAVECIRLSEHSFSIVTRVTPWTDLMLSICGRVQCPTSATGCCGYNGLKQCLYIYDVKQLMLDIKREVELAIQRQRTLGTDANCEQRDLARVNTALQEVDGEGINEAGWFSDFLAVYVALAYGVTILIIRENGFFSYIQVLHFGLHWLFCSP